MNASVYIFGKFNGAYSQYPNDYTSEIFHKFYEKSKTTTQIVIHRDDNLMYYGYIRKLNRECYIGFCIVLNCLMFTCIDKIFLLFENAISMLVIEGKFIHFNAQGEICNSVEELSLHKEEVFALEESLRVGVNALKNVAEALPTVSYGIQKDTFREFVVDDNLEAIIKSSYSNGYTYIYKDEGFNTAKLNSYKDVLVRLNNEKESLQDKLNKINRKKVYTFILFGALIICSIYLLSAYKSLKDTQSELYETHKLISEKDNINIKSRLEILEKGEKISKSELEISELRNVNKGKDEKISNLSLEISELRNVNKEKDEKISKLSLEISELRNVNKGKDEKISNLSLEISELRNVNKEKDEKISYLSLEISKLRNKNKEKDEKISKLSQEISKLRNKNKEQEKELKKINNEVAKYKSTNVGVKDKQVGVNEEAPIIISDIKIVNIDSDGSKNYEGIIFSSRSMYLTPKITYKSKRSGNITLNIKLYTPSELSRGISSPNNSRSYNMSILEGKSGTKELSRFGESKKGYWPVGKYRFEIWYNNKCLKTKEFIIY